MWQQKWRKWLKTGPLNGVYFHVRRVKRRLRHEPYQHLVRYNPSPLPAGELRAAIAQWPDHARLYFTLGRDYLETGDPEALGKALACLRSARALKMEAVERLSLYQAFIEARRGEAGRARLRLETLAPEELTPSEAELREQILNGAVEACATPLPFSDWEPVRRQVERTGASSLLVVGDRNAWTADWLLDADYLLADPEATGLDLAGAVRLDRCFDLVVSAAQSQPEAQKVGLRFQRWIQLPEIREAAPDPEVREAEPAGNRSAHTVGSEER